MSRRKKTKSLVFAINSVAILSLISIFAVVFQPITKRPVVEPIVSATKLCYTVPNNINQLSPQIEDLIQDYNQDTRFESPVIEEKVTKQINYKGITIKITDEEYFTDTRVKMLTNAIDLAPQVLSDLRPQYIYLVNSNALRFSKDKDMELSHDGFTIEPNIYLFPHVFENFPQRYVNELLFHEWGHIVQHYSVSLETPTSQKRRYSSYGLIRLSTISPFITNYAIGVGWTNAQLEMDTQSQKQSEYGKTNVVEDQAETISLYITKQSDKLSVARQNWVIRFLGCQQQN